MPLITAPLATFFLVCWWRKLAKNQWRLPAFFLGCLAWIICMALCKISLSALGPQNYMHFESANVMHFWIYFAGVPLCLTTTHNITTKHVCKAFLQEYRIRDIRFRVLWSKQDPNAKGEDEHEGNRKKTGPQRRRGKRPRKKIRKNEGKKKGPPRTSRKKTKKMENQEKYLEFCAFFLLRLFSFFFAFFLMFFFAFFWCPFCCFFLLFLGAAVSVRGVFGDPNLWYNFLWPWEIGFELLYD